ncbi:MAG: peptidylprolyl isomerase [Desulfobacterales bacterium]
MKKCAFLIMCLFFVGCFFSIGYAETIDSAPMVRLETSLGDIIIELNPAAAPKTVENFLAYVNNGFYTGTIFHRVIKGFMIRGRIHGNHAAERHRLRHHERSGQRP